MTDNPFFPKDQSDNNKAAADLVRLKLDRIFEQEPSAKKEIQEIKEEIALEKKEPVSKRSKLSTHQQFMYDLSHSGKTLAEIQTAWHNYYINLNDEKKYEVWNEFYDANGHTPQFFEKVSSKIQAAGTARDLPPPVVRPQSNIIVAEHVLSPPKKASRHRNNTIRDEVVRHVSAKGKLKARHHLQSLAFGIGVGMLAIFIFLFGFFNEVIIAPFIQPSRNISSTPLILSSDNNATTSGPEVIIPKINVEIPVDYTQTSTDESVIENALESGVVHYPSTVLPGQVGNAAFFGHSSNNIFNPGKYKFAFVLLHTIVPGDTFYLVYHNVEYVYQVYKTAIVDPTDVSVLNNVPGKTATATLITCDPPGTSIHRLVVWGTQVSPNPDGNTAASPTLATSQPAPTELPGNGPSLWSRFIHLF